MTGNEIDAKSALMGFGEFIGSGCDRRAYLINNVVYKVQQRNRFRANEVEFENFRDHEETDRIKFPANHLYYIDGNAVMAMEYIDGTCVGECYCIEDLEACNETCLDELEVNDLLELGMTDICYGNVIRKDSFLYIVDFGE
jgi:hypothetical protein